MVILGRMIHFWDKNVTPFPKMEGEVCHQRQSVLLDRGKWAWQVLFFSVMVIWIVSKSSGKEGKWALLFLSIYVGETNRTPVRNCRGEKTASLGSQMTWAAALDTVPLEGFGPGLQMELNKQNLAISGPENLKTSHYSHRLGTEGVEALSFEEAYEWPNDVFITL